MRQVWITRAGGPEVLQVRETRQPKPIAQEVSIKVHAAGINFADIMARIGLYPDAPKMPCVVGYEVSGEVLSVGPGVERFAPGDRVLALTRFGGYSETVCVPQVQVAAIGDELSYESAAAVPVTYLTAWLMLMRLGNLQPGDRVLVQAAAGGVGQAAVQICKWRGAEVIGTASAGKHARLRQSGVAHCIDYRNQDFLAEVMRITDGEGVDIVLDAVGGKSFQKSYECLRSLGRLFCFGGSSFAPGDGRNLVAIAKAFLSMPSFKPMALMDKNRGVFGVNLGHLWHRTDTLQGEIAQVVELVRDGTFVPVVDAVYPFDQAGEAHEYIKARKNFGKVLLVP